jgi:hypothetical protein
MGFGWGFGLVSLDLPGDGLANVGRQAQAEAVRLVDHAGYPISIAPQVNPLAVNVPFAPCRHVQFVRKDCGHRVSPGRKVLFLPAGGEDEDLRSNYEPRYGRR